MEILLLLYINVFFVILIHELGHLLAVIFASHKLIEFAVGPVSIKFSETGCSIRPRAGLFSGVVIYNRNHGKATWANEILIITAGVIVNIVVGATLVLIYHFVYNNGLFVIAGWLSIWLGLLGLFPMRVKILGLDSDGKRFFAILALKKHVSQLKKYNLDSPATYAKIWPSDGANLGKAQIELLNDDSTPMEFVVDAIKTFFGFNDFSAMLLMLSIHKDGNAKLGWLEQDVAKNVSEQINSEARSRGFPFQCRVLTT